MRLKVLGPGGSLLRRRLALLAMVVGLIPSAVLTSGALGYPLDGFEHTGIRRLLGYLRQQSAPSGPKLPVGALLGWQDIRLHLTAQGRTWDLDEKDRDPALQAALQSIFERRDPSYGVVVVDFTDPAKLVWAGLREDRSQLPGSVGKLGCLVALFDGLRRVYPDVEARQRILRERVIDASDWAVGDPHSVPKYSQEEERNRFSRVALGDRFTLAEWVDHMISASANSAGAMVWKEAMLLRQFGESYPPSAEQEAAFFRDTPKTELTRLSLAVINEPLAAAGIRIEGFQQGTMFTKVGQARIPGVRSYATPRELARILLRLEQGRLVDEWSSLEMKRYLYMTKRRYRYVYAPELAAAAVYFKSGSFYRCAPEEGYVCRQYEGNVENLMNSVVIVESPARPDPSRPDAKQKRYLVAMTSNVLRVNSAWDHSRIGAAIEAVVQTRRATKVEDTGSETEKRRSGEG